MEYPAPRAARRMCTVFLTAGQLLAAGAIAGDLVRTSGRKTGASPSRSPTRNPRVSPEMAQRHAFELVFAYRGAIDSLERNDACRALFDELSLGGLEALGRSRYEPPPSTGEPSFCVPGVAAYTLVGAPRVVVCGHFFTLHHRIRMAVLLHEALHTAGLSEQPLDPEGMASEEITERIVNVCSR